MLRLLGIVQDDTSTKHLQLAQMDLVYQRALLTLAAISGDDAQSVLPGATLNSRPQKAMSVQKFGMTLAFDPPSLGSLIHEYIYFKRAWVLQ